MIRLKMYPALNGDCFLIRGEGGNVLVDGGYATTLNDYVRRDLEQIAAAGQRLDLLVATHIDQDHILGTIALLEANGPESRRSIIEIDAIWFNSLRGLAAPIGAQESIGGQGVLKSLARLGYPTRATEFTTAKISAGQGSSLGSLIRRGGYSWNSSSGRRCVDDSWDTIALGPGHTVSVLGPPKKRLEELHRHWMRELRKRGYRGPDRSSDELDDAFEFLSARARERASPTVKTISSNDSRSLAEAHTSDASVANGSSIVTLVEMSGVRLLLLADAWAGDVVDAMKRLRAAGDSLLFDVVKISHHGSLKNTNVELLGMIDAPVYLVSTDGSRHDHPDIEVLKEIVDRPAAFSRTIHFNYRTNASQALRVHQASSGSPFTVVEESNNWIEVHPSS